MTMAGLSCNCPTRHAAAAHRPDRATAHLAAPAAVPPRRDTRRLTQSSRPLPQLLPRRDTPPRRVDQTVPRHTLQQCYLVATRRRGASTRTMIDMLVRRLSQSCAALSTAVYSGLSELKRESQPQSCAALSTARSTGPLIPRGLPSGAGLGLGPLESDMALFHIQPCRFTVERAVEPSCKSRYSAVEQSQGNGRDGREK